MKFIYYYEKYMNFAGPLGNLLFFLQAIKIFNSHSAEAISFEGFLLSFFTLNSWLLYGILIKSRPLIITNILGVIGVVLVLIGTLMYR